MLGNKRSLFFLLIALSFFVGGCRGGDSLRYANIDHEIEKILSEKSHIGLFPFLDNTGHLTAVNWRYSDVVKTVFVNQGLVDPFSSAEIAGAIKNGYLRWNDTIDIEAIFAIARQLELDYIITGGFEEFTNEEYPRVTISLKIYRVNDGLLLYFDEQSGSGSRNRFNLPGVRKISEAQVLSEVGARLNSRFGESIIPLLKTVKSKHLKNVWRLFKQSEKYGLKPEDKKYILQSRFLIEQLELPESSVNLHTVRVILRLEDEMHGILLAYKVEEQMRRWAMKR